MTAAQKPGGRAGRRRFGSKDNTGKDETRMRADKRGWRRSMAAMVRPRRIAAAGFSRLLKAAGSVILAAMVTASASAATINPVIDSDHILQPDGRLVVEAYLSNAGDLPLHHATATVFFADQASRSEDLGDCLPEMDVAFTATFDTAAIAPGDYLVMVRFNFEEPSTRKHRSFHTRPVLIPGPAGAAPPAPTLLEGSAKGPTFNPKAFWKDEDRIRLTLTNGHAAPITPHIVFYLPNAFFSPHGTLRPTLAPQQPTAIDIPLVYTGEFANGGPFTAVAQYELDGRHYATAIGGDVLVVSQPVMFKGFIAAALLALLAAGLYLVRRPKPQKTARSD